MTINEIARLAGVSRATVSRYLNDGYVSEEKKGENPPGGRADRIPAFRPGPDAADEKDQAGGGDYSQDKF